jgi:cytoskeleton protein RodZ
MSDAMSDAPETTSTTSAPRTAGSILREARQAQGVHIGALAATIKVTQGKLESLEADRLDDLPDATFTRALAQTVCRALKIDPAPVLALLPQPAGHRLEHVAEGLKEPFRERSGQSQSGDWTAMLASPAAWGVLAIVVLTAVVYLMPQNWLSRLQSPSSGASAPAPSASSTVSTTVVATPAPVQSSEPAAAASAPGIPLVAASSPVASPVAAASGVPATAPATAPPALRLRTVARSWIEVQDARSQVLLSRMVEAGEAIDLDGPTPLRLKIGNARGTEVLFRGRALDLAPSTRDNVARLELQ